MSNSWFEFKQFRIEQNKCAMKITTDACIQGAWTPVSSPAKRLLDIGTGTGLLSLMLAQRNPGILIDAVELDPEAASQAAENVALSPWHERIKVMRQDIRDHISPVKYDLIICNPPFFANSLLGDGLEKNQARHDVSLKKEELLHAANSNLSENGHLSLLLPHTEYQQWKEPAARVGLYEKSCLHIRHRPDASVKRVVSIMSRIDEISPAQYTLTIQDEDGRYSAEFIALLSPFYLNL